MVKAKLVKPIEIYPDSTRSYFLKEFIDLVKYFNKEPVIRSINDPTKKKFARILVDLEKIREKQPKSRPIPKERIKELQTLANDLRKRRNLAIHDKNWIMNASLINSREYRARKKVKHKITDVLFYILFARPEKPIHGRIAMTKQVFLTIKEILGEENVENPKFVPYRYGPYSFLLTHIMTNLEFDGLLHIKGRKNTSSEKFTLTDKGLKIAKKKFAKLSPKLQDELIDRRRGWDQNHIKGILAYVYNKYPEYTEKSLLKKKYKSITWGRAKG